MILVHISNSSLNYDSRIKKQLSAVNNAAIFNKIIYLTLRNSDNACVLSNEFQFCNMIAVKLLTKNLGTSAFAYRVQYIEWIIRSFLLLLKIKPTVIQVHNYAPLPIAVLVKKFVKCLIVYDAHELQSDSNGLSPIQKKRIFMLEKHYIRSVDHLIVVSHSIGEWYKKNMNVHQISVIYNVPMMQTAIEKVENIREKWSIPSDAILFMYQGAFIPGRFLLQLISLFSEMSDRNRHLVLMGEGWLKSTLENASQAYEHIHVIPAVAPENLLSITAQADIGLSIIENICLSYYYCMPNKFFEYNHAGVPVIVSDFPDLATMVDRYECGWKVDPDSLHTIKQLLDSVSKSDIEHKKRNTVRIRNDFNWSKEQQKYLQIFDDLLQK